MEPSAAAEIFPAVGSAAAQLHATDWAATSLGDPSRWPLALVGQVRAILHTHQPMCLFWGPELVNLYNEAFLPILGEKHPSAMGQRAEECWGEAWSLVGPQLHRVLEGESIYQTELLVPIARNGRVDDAWFNYSYSPLYDDGGAPAGVLVVCTEITREILARRRVELAGREAELARAELERVFMQSPVPLCILSGPEHHFALANGPFRAFVGRDVVGKTLAEAFAPEERAYYAPLMDRVYRTGEPVVLHASPLHLLDANGTPTERFIDVAYHPDRRVDGSIAGVLVSVVDVTQQVVARRQIEAAVVEQAAARKQADALRLAAESASRAKDEFLATVSHELRTPLTAILGWSQILERNADASRLRKGLEVIDRNARAQAKLIDDILDVSRIVSGKLRLQVTAIDASAVAHAAAESVRPAAVAKGIELRIAIDAQSPFPADEDRLQQILWNLLANAVKFTPAGGHVALTLVEKRDVLEIVVRDDGAGIDPAFLPFVFDRFRQADASTIKQHAGLGLGLAIVRHLVELHGGTVRAESAGRGTGAAFHVVLPRRALAPSEEMTAEDRASESESRRRSEAGAPLRELRILVVDDQDDARELVVVVLEEAGATVTQASSAAGALAALATSSFDALVSDIGMPDQDGYALIAKVRETSRVPALALTAFARPEDRARALASGFDGHHTKPIEPHKLVAAVAAIAGR